MPRKKNLNSTNKTKLKSVNKAKLKPTKIIEIKSANNTRPKITKKHKIIHLDKIDKDWFLTLFHNFKKELNSYNPEEIWDRYRRHLNHKQFIIGIRPYAFCRFSYLTDGTKVINELVTDPKARRAGLAKALVLDIGKPCIVACYKEIEGFYKKLGFIWFGNVINNKNEVLEVYRWV